MTNELSKFPVHDRQKRTIIEILRLLFGWNRSSYFMMSSFFIIVSLIVVVWWPLADEYISQYNSDYPFWMQFDWLLLGIFVTMSLLIMSGADIKKDLLIVIIGLFGGLVIESWGTQTNLWSYYTFERPPLWIIPAWPIASLSIDRIVRIMNNRLPVISPKITHYIYWLLFSIFFLIMNIFIRNTIDKSLTWIAIITCSIFIITPTDHRIAVITFIAGSGLGYFLERWGTTRACWTYYTYETPPVFAVFAHGLAAVSFWRTSLIVKNLYHSILNFNFFNRTDNKFLNTIYLFVNRMYIKIFKIDAHGS